MELVLVWIIGDCKKMFLSRNAKLGYKSSIILDFNSSLYDYSDRLLIIHTSLRLLCKLMCMGWNISVFSVLIFHVSLNNEAIECF